MQFTPKNTKGEGDLKDHPNRNDKENDLPNSKPTILLLGWLPSQLALHPMAVSCTSFLEVMIPNDPNKFSDPQQKNIQELVSIEPSTP